MERTPAPDYVRELRDEASRRRKRLEDAEAEIKRVKAEAAEKVAELTARIAADHERALAAEAKLAALT